MTSFFLTFFWPYLVSKTCHKITSGFSFKLDSGKEETVLVFGFSSCVYNAHTFSCKKFLSFLTKEFVTPFLICWKLFSFLVQRFGKANVLKGHRRNFCKTFTQTEGKFYFLFPLIVVIFNPSDWFVISLSENCIGSRNKSFNL